MDSSNQRKALAGGIIGSALWTTGWEGFSIYQSMGGGMTPSPWPAIAGMFVFGVLTVKWATGYRDENERLQQELVDAKSHRPRPSVILTFESPTLRVFNETDVAESPLIAHNEGNPSALRVRFAPVQFNPTVRMEIDEIPMIGPYHAVPATVWLIDQDNGPTRRQSRFGWVIARAYQNAVFTGAAEQILAWPLSVTYMDAGGAEYQREFTVSFDRQTMRASVVFMR